MTLWGKIARFLHLSPPVQKDKTESGLSEVDYGDRIKPPNGVAGKTAGGRSINPKDGSNPANPFSPSKRDRW